MILPLLIALAAGALAPASPAQATALQPIAGRSLQYDVWHVDAAASAGGNGSAGAPFAALTPAFAAAASGDLIHVAAGSYAGAGNRGLDLAQRALRVRGAGAGHVVIDLEGGGRFLSAPAGNPFSEVTGLTLKNGQVSGNGGALAFGTGSFVRLIDVAVTDSTAGAAGGGVWSDGALLLTDCAFVGNSAVTTGGAIHGVHGVGALRCVFDRNSAHRGGAIASLGEAVITHGVFRSNSATEYGGAAYIAAGGSPGYLIDTTLFTANVSDAGGALFAVPDNPTAHVHACTFVANDARAQATSTLTGGPHIYFAGPGAAWLHNTILDGPLGAQGEHVVHQAATLEVLASNLAGGEATIHRPQGASLAWGAGNLDGDPVFVNAPLGDYRLAPGSPCVDAGWNTLMWSDRLDANGNADTVEPNPHDLLGRARRIDDGAVPDSGVGSGALLDMGALERLP